MCGVVVGKAPRPRSLIIIHKFAIAVSISGR
jgi:hypothetical protein